MSQPFDEIRSRTADVMRRARVVHIDESRLKAYARELPIDRMQSPTIDESSHLIDRDRPEATALYFIALDSINFGSGYFPHLKKRPGKSGYYTVATCLAARFTARGPMSADELATLTPADCHAIFEQPIPQNDSEPARELMTLFARALNDLGQLLESHFDGSASNLIRSCNHSAAKMVSALARMPFYRDVQRYDDHGENLGRAIDVPFYKRAQLTAADLSIALKGHELGRFDDLDQLTIFADNLVPHVLRVDGVLIYEAELGHAIDAERLIEANSAQEIEMRAAAVHACEQLVHELRKTGHSITAAQVDYLLWHRGGTPFYKARPRHRARTVFY